MGKRHVVKLLDHFEHHGPNGTHLCLVFPVLISDGKEMVRAGKPCQISSVQAIAKQILLGLDFLHSQSIIHCGKDLSHGFRQNEVRALINLVVCRSETCKHHVCSGGRRLLRRLHQSSQIRVRRALERAPERSKRAGVFDGFSERAGDI
ncbi:uncharacterized protein LDX57_000637 [Aspergillus melleus]|uniref:uncharacterized protein n=1 Tax=Aspergillus melleus TaxID=138277 RepID=UPI001E8CF1EE|nr:uncharacterized protein LDX57_000637 [Aspergillus melleus]KAH8422884.1 hypothetical protein LDX57_000637 [Aspergillus melleus]